MRPGRLLLVAVAALLIAGGCARVAVKEPPPPGAPPEAPPPKAQVRGALVPVGIAVPLEGAVVEAGGVKATVRGDNTFELPPLPPGKQQVVVEKRFPAGEVRRVLGVATVYVSDAPVAVSLKVRDATDVDAFCLDCHPPLKKVTRRDQKARDVHVSGIVPRLARGDPSLLDAKGRVTCESCHTPHRPGANLFFGIADIKSGHFCNRCHGTRR